MSLLIVNSVNNGNYSTIFDSINNQLKSVYNGETLVSLTPTGIKFDKVNPTTSTVIRKFLDAESTPTEDIGIIFKKNIGFMHWNGTQYVPDVIVGTTIVPTVRQKKYIKVYNYTSAWYDVFEYGHEAKFTTTSPLTISLLSNFDEILTITPSFVGQGNPNGTPVSAGAPNSNSFDAYTTSGFTGLYISYVAYGFSNS